MFGRYSLFNQSILIDDVFHMPLQLVHRVVRELAVHQDRGDDELGRADGVAVQRYFLFPHVQSLQ